MSNFEQLNKKEKFRNFCQFIFIALLPIVGLVLISGYTLSHIKSDFHFVEEEIEGLELITQIQKSIFKLQKIRGLSCVHGCSSVTKDETVSLEIQRLQKRVFVEFTQLKELVASQKHSLLNQELLTYIDTIDLKKAPQNFESMTQVITQLLHFCTRLAYSSNLKLEPNLESYLMVDNSVFILPIIIEYNGQIRAISSGIQNKELTPKQQEQIRLQIQKIQEKLGILEYNYSLLRIYPTHQDLEEDYKTMLDAQRDIIATLQEGLLQKKSVQMEGLEIYTMISKNIDLIIKLQNNNAEALKHYLLLECQSNRSLLYGLLIIGLCSLFFILYVNYYFYQANRRFIEMMEELSITDPMTKLYNRRYFDLIIEEQLQLLQRQKFAFMILDIDFFKQYNDTYGHQAGDKALIKVAECIRTALRRESDMAFRLGGEEFGVIAVGMDEEQALKLAHTIKELIEAEKIAHETSSVSSYLSISIGVLAVSFQKSWNVNKVYRSADKALYQAKGQGRDQVVLFNTQL